MKKIFLLSLSLVFGLYSNAWAETTVLYYGDDCGDGCHWSIDSEGNLSVTGSSDNAKIKDYNYYGTWGGDSPWYQYSDSITSVNVSNIKDIGQAAFASLKNITSVNIGEGTQTIAHAAFAIDGNLSEITIPESVTSISLNAFYSTAIEELTIPSNASIVTHANCEKSSDPNCGSWSTLGFMYKLKKINYSNPAQKAMIEDAMTTSGISLDKLYRIIDNTPVQSYTVATATERVNDIGGCEEIKCSLKIWFK